MGKAERQWRLSSRSFERRTTNLSSRRAGCERSRSTQQQSKGLFLFLRFLRPFTGKWKWFRRSNANTSLLKTEREEKGVCERERERERERESLERGSQIKKELGERASVLKREREREREERDNGSGVGSDRAERFEEKRCFPFFQDREGEEVKERFWVFFSFCAFLTVSFGGRAGEKKEERHHDDRLRRRESDWGREGRQHCCC